MSQNLPARFLGITVDARMRYEMRYAAWERHHYEHPANSPVQERVRRRRWLFEEPQ